MTDTADTRGFRHVTGVKSGAIIELVEKFMKDTHADKLSLNAGAYRDNDGRPFLLPSIAEAARRVTSSASYNHEYLGMGGNETYLRGARQLAFGNTVSDVTVASLQTIGGTGACHMGAVFLQQFYRPNTTVYISDPSWENHQTIFDYAGFPTATYAYWDEARRGIDEQGMLDCLVAAPSGSIIILHACGHNPTGCDLSPETWQKVLEVVQSKGHFAFFDTAYQGFVSGDLEKDAAPIRLFAQAGVPLAVAQSFSKNAGLYGERLGALHVVCADAATAVRVSQQLKFANRREISSAARYGADLMAEVFSDEELYALWKADLRTMSSRLASVRQAFVDKLLELGTPGDWSHIVGQRGMFAYTGLASHLCNKLIDDHHIYVPPSGRFSVAGLNDGNVSRIATAVDRVVREGSKETST